MVEIYRGNLEHIRRQVQDQLNTLENSISDLEFTDLTDTPASLVADKFVAVNSGGTALELVDAPSGGMSYALKASSQNLGSGSFVDVTDMSFAVDANKDYPFNLCLFINDPANAGVTITLTVPSGTAWSWGLTTSAVRTDSNQINLGGAATVAIYQLSGVVAVSSTAGTVQLRALRNTAPGLNPSINANSYISNIAV